MQFHQTTGKIPACSHRRSGRAKTTSTESQGTAPLDNQAASRRGEAIKKEKEDGLGEGGAAERRAPVVELTVSLDGKEYIATVQGVPDISSRGKTPNEAVANIKADLEASTYAYKYRIELPELLD